MNITEKIKRKAFNLVGSVINGLSQNEAKLTENLDRTVTEGMPELLRKAGAEGTVLLRNDNVLPFNKDNVISLFGRVQFDYMFVGYGSGGDVIKPYTVNPVEGLENAGAKLNESLRDTYKEWCEKNPPDHGFWGHWPLYYDEMPIETAAIEAAAKESDCAVIFIGRSAGEDRENKLEAGSYYLTEDEKSLIKRVSTAFKKTAVVLNIGSVIDMSWEDECLKDDSAILIPWQGGMESGNSLADVLLGTQEPSGRLADTIALSYEDYPCSKDFGEKEFNNYTEDIYVGYRYFETFAQNKVKYPFGFGLGYSQFKKSFVGAIKDEDSITLTLRTENTGSFCGKDVLQLYASQPQGALGKPAKVLCGYAKSNTLANGEAQELEISVPLYYLASYDDCGKTGFKYCYVLEKGAYDFYLGSNVRDCERVYSFDVPETIVISQHEQTCAAQGEFSRILPKEENGRLTVSHEAAPVSEENLKQIILDNLPSELEKSDKPITFDDVKADPQLIDKFVSQLSLTELEAISRGDYTMDSPLGNKGNAGAMGGVLPSLRDKGIPPIITTDGPSGIRIGACCSLLPIGTSLSAMWNTDLAQAVYEKVGAEMKVKGSDILLAPGMNIHRSPLCGRNFEYYSEDPLVTGKTAAAVVRGVQLNGVAACPKHFACNSQETNRSKTDSRLSERALREIYLKGFELCVKDANPYTIMTSYNKINGVWGHYNYNLCTRLLRKEWGFKGLVMTDWWMQPSKSPEFPKMCNNAYRVRAGVDVLMPGGNRAGKRKPDKTLLVTYNKPQGITLGEMQHTAKHVVELALKIK
ncbi:MAG: glycoside hydrolase family 3 C-terminal domain-containing protein [Clostridia bacterium]|nr:glycoside hydrolase family 3 C-terminal domain-containing protein [Clostridia bacterium]